MVYRRTPREQARLDAVRGRIVAAAVDLIRRGGWAAVSVAAVAAEAGVATGTVYRHVADKDELCAEAFRSAAGQELAVVREAVDDAVDAPTRIEAGLRAFASRALAAPRLARALLAEPAGAVVEAERIGHRAAHRDAFARALRDGVADGAFGAHDVEVVAAVLVGAMGEALVGPLAAIDRRDTGAQVDDLVHACLRALPTPT